MTALRTTRSVRPHPPRWRAAAAAVLIGLCGCGGPTGSPGGDRPSMTRLPQPNPERIGYNTDTGMLTLYDLPANGRWLVHDDDDTKPVLVGRRHQLPAGTDPETTFIAYREPSGLRSRPIRLADVVAAHAPDPSQLR